MFAVNLQEVINEIQKIVPGDDNVKLDMSQVADLIMTMKFSLQVQGKICTGAYNDLCICLPFDLAECDPDDEYDQSTLKLVVGRVDYARPEESPSCRKLVRPPYEFNICAYDFGCGPVKSAVRPAISNAYFAKYPQFEIFKKISGYNTFAKAAYYFDIENMPFAPMTKCPGGVKSHIFFNEDMAPRKYWRKLLALHPRTHEVEYVEYYLNEMIARKRIYCNMSDEYIDDGAYLDEVMQSKVYDAGQKLIFDFKTADGLTIMKIAKRYRYLRSHTVKEYVPLTNWGSEKRWSGGLFPVPYPKYQPLCNLQLFDGKKYVVFCPNVEIADKLQRNTEFENVVFTAFLCDEGRFHQVDFTPLGGKEVVQLIVNHSGMEPEDALVESMALYDYLKNNKPGIRYADLHRVMMAVDYNIDGEDFHSMHEYVELYEAPTSIKGSAMIVSETEFDNLSLQAQIRIAERDVINPPFWMDEDDVEEAETEDKPTGGEQLMRGVIARGCITYIMGQTGSGKTSLTTSLCAYLVNTSQRAERPLKELCWTRCKTTSKYDRLKILYLDFEANESTIHERVKDFVNPYMPDDSKDRKACLDNFIVHVMDDYSINFSAEEHFDDLCGLIDDCSAGGGVKGQPVDILVIDTYWTFVQQHDTNFDVLNKLKAAYPHMAIVVLHHLKDNGTAYGRGDKLFNADTTIEISSTGNGGTLHSPRQIKLGLKHRFVKCEQETKPFTIMLNDENKWVVVDPPYTEAEMIGILKRGYGLKNAELADLLGMSERKAGDITRKEK